MGPLPDEMPLPLVPSWIEKWRCLAGNWISAREIRSFVAVAVKTGQGQIARYRPATVFPRDDVIDLERWLIVLLGNPAVFTTCSCAGPY